MLIVVGAALAAEAAPDQWGQRVEADWLVQLETAQHGSRPGPRVSTRSDAAGGVDGVINGKWGFHTHDPGSAWWQVDLGAGRALDRVAVYNRCDLPSRAASLSVLLGDDGKTWRKAYTHDGSPFYGATDKKPLVVPLKGAKARLVRLTVPGGMLHLDEIEVYAESDPKTNIALRRPADQSSTSPWSSGKLEDPPERATDFPIAEIVARGRALAEVLTESGVDVAPTLRELSAVEAEAARLEEKAPPEKRRALYFRARWSVRKLALANPLLDFDRLLVTQRVPGSYSHMSDQYYGWWARPGGGLFVLEGFLKKPTDRPVLRCLTSDWPAGSFLRPDLSYDGQRVLFAYAKHCPGQIPGDKTQKDKIPAEAFYHLFEMDLATGKTRQLTGGRYDDFDGRYLPGGEIVFLSTRKGTAVQCGRDSAAATVEGDALPDSFVRCGGGRGRPVSVYTLHVVDADGTNLRAISAFENFEWTPMVAADGRITYARWDYIDRPNGPYMSLWSTNPDGTNPQLVYGNFTVRPHCIFEARQVPHSAKFLFTASGHHYQTGGSLVLLDPTVGTEGLAPLKRLTPEVPFPEAEGSPQTYYANPWPLSERFWLAAWSDKPLRSEGGQNPRGALGVYLMDAFGNKELLWRDPDISTMYPIPVKRRPRPPVVSSAVTWEGRQQGAFLLADAHQGLDGVERGSVKRLRLVAVVPKVQPEMNRPNLGVSGEDPGKFVFGTVPVEADGSAHFRVPSGVPFFFQALDADGMTVRTMRTLTYVQPGQTLSCVGCHEPRNAAPPVAAVPLAARRDPSKAAPGPEGSWPLRFDRLVQPVVDKHCLRCHAPGKDAAAAGKMDLSGGKGYDALIRWGNTAGLARERNASEVGDGVARRSDLLKLLGGDKPHHNVRLDADARRRLVTWLDVYAHRQGSFSERQEAELTELRKVWAELLAE